ncbi:MULTISPECIES: StfH/YfcO family fimbrial adhesin [unclassified Escherichia]|uniref:StfH/YfcO family fimbrial adhesin n=1 Tax=unclassified Escherichia TaxID=2608889 RepID=UPI000CF6F61F|nr:MULTISPECIES: StfH/YfcO family fimbrial adhesin [unclassified Escherichia]
MKKISSFLLFLLLAIGLTNSSIAKPNLKISFNSQTLYYGIGDSGVTNVALHMNILTPNGLFGGDLAPGVKFYVNYPYKLTSWRLISGSGPLPPTPTITITDYDNSNVDDALCGGSLPKGWNCGWYKIKVETGTDSYGCPWVANIWATSTNAYSGTYAGPVSHGSICPTVPVASFDISWSKDRVQNDMLLNIASTGGVVHANLPTYLMESGKLCDGSLNDTRGSYCRYVSQMTQLTSQGCTNVEGGNSNVTAVVADSSPYDQTLSNIAVEVNTAGTGQFTTECYFQYLMEEL